MEETDIQKSLEDNPQKLHLPDGHFIAYHKLEGKQNHPGVVFLSGFMSDMTGTKATALENFCRERGYNFIRFDYFGHGQSSHKFTDCTISTWKQNVLDVLDNLTSGKQILIGSSMGGWLMLLVALERPMRIAALIGIASAPDFTEDLIWDKMTPTQQQGLLEHGVFNLKSDFSDNPYPVTKQLIEDGRKHLLLREKGEGLVAKGSKKKKREDKNNSLSFPSPFSLFPSSIPVRLIHGLKDIDVPSSISTRLAEKLASNDVQVNLVENGDHRMSTPENIELLCNTLATLIHEYDF